DSFFAQTFINMPTPRSKPSRTKYPIHSTAMRMNHNVGRNSMMVFYLSVPVETRISMRRTTHRTMVYGRHHRCPHPPTVQASPPGAHLWCIEPTTRLRLPITTRRSASMRQGKIRSLDRSLLAIPPLQCTARPDQRQLDPGLEQQ